MSEGLVPDEPVAGNAYEAEEHLAADLPFRCRFGLSGKSICSIQRR